MAVHLFLLADSSELWTAMIVAGFALYVAALVIPLIVAAVLLGRLPRLGWGGLLQVILPHLLWCIFFALQIDRKGWINLTVEPVLVGLGAGFVLSVVSYRREATKSGRLTALAFAFACALVISVVTPELNSN